MEPFNFKEDTTIRVEYLVPSGEKCINCKYYDSYADWCKLFHADIHNDIKNFSCIKSLITSKEKL